MNENEQQLKGYSRKLETFLGLSTAAILAGTAILYAVYPSGMGQEQPIPFSHRLHSGVKQISCVFCHDTSIENEHAGIPPLQRCMLCHSKIIIDYPPIINILQAHYSKGEPVEWKKINTLPDHVHFFHGIHLAKGFDCSRCHGDVAAMDRIVLEHKFDMGFCIKCHKDENATIDCFNCHY